MITYNIKYDNVSDKTENEKNKTFKCWKNIHTSNVLNSRKSIKKKYIKIIKTDTNYSPIYIRNLKHNSHKTQRMNLLWFDWILV